MIEWLNFLDWVVMKCQQNNPEFSRHLLFIHWIWKLISNLPQKLSSSMDSDCVSGFRHANITNLQWWLQQLKWYFDLFRQLLVSCTLSISYIYVFRYLRKQLHFWSHKKKNCRSLMNKKYFASHISVLWFCQQYVILIFISDPAEPQLGIWMRWNST